MRDSQQRTRFGRRAFLGLSGSTALALLGAPATAKTDGTATDGRTVHQVEGGAVPQHGGVRLEAIGRYESGLFDEGGAEIVDYHPPTQRLFVINSDLGGVDVLDVSDPTDPTKLAALDVAGELAGVSSANSVSASTATVAVAIEAENAQEPGQVGFYDPETLDLLGTATVGPLPDKVTFTPDGQKALVANEGEPNEEYTVDPRGSVSVVDISAGADAATVSTAGFAQFDGMEGELRDRGIRIFGPGASASQDFEPEYVTVSDDSTTAWVSLQENNAIAEIDIESATVTKLLPLGFKDYSLAGNELDASNEDGGVNIRNWPINGILQPDAIGSYSVGDETYIVTANEGDGRDYDGFSEEREVADLDLDPEAFDFDSIEGIDSVEELQRPENLGAKGVTTTLGDTDGDGLYEEIYVFGGRSFSIFNTDGERVFDSGSDFERITAERFPDQFNNDNDESDPDGRSDNKGPEPEGIALGQVGDRHYAFIGLERIGGVMVYDITDPESPAFVQYINERDFSVDIEAEIEDGDAPASAAGDLGPEGLAFATAAESPIDEPLVFVGHEVSGTTVIFRVATSVVGIDSLAVRNGASGSVDLSLLSARDGFSGGRLTVSVADTDVAEIVSASYNDAFGLTQAPTVGDGGSSVELEIVDTERAVESGATNVPLATIDLTSVGAGTTDLVVEVEAFDSDAGETVDAATQNGVVITGPSSVGRSGAAPTDLDDDGRYEDVNGNGRVDYDDVVLLFEQFDSDSVRMNADAYDFNENGKLDYDDIVDLYEEV
ncbi:choice-of-anchor I family protein [Salinigranum halophilum]|uniref:choice-of-anchor I family protein n=1 Tax=Salinigranum halophilum TaxID=2565931 RepID=UPI001F36F3D7|nr:choice-of-anchor I family protein [Salinigranum halophilum]